MEKEKNISLIIIIWNIINICQNKSGRKSVFKFKM